MSEEDVVSLVADAYSSIGAVILTASPNQITAFKFFLSSGRRKAPDLAFVWDETLYIGEAKVRPLELLKQAQGTSDIDALIEIRNNQSIQDLLLTEAEIRLENSVGGSYGRPRKVCAFAAANNLPTVNAASFFERLRGIPIVCSSEVPIRLRFT